MKIKKDKVASNSDFIRGIAYSVSWLIKAHDEESIALELLEQSGYDYTDLLFAECDPYDLKPIADALGIQVDGKPRKLRGC